MIAADERAAMAETVRKAVADAVREGRDIDALLAKLGWREMLDDNPGDAIDIVFSALGAANATATALDDILVSALGREPCDDVAVLLPSFATWDVPGRIDGGDLHATGIATARASRARELVVSCIADSGARAVVVPMSNADVRRVQGADPDLGLHAVRVRASAEHAAHLESCTWSSAIDLARRALAHQTAGACRAMLDLARTHALQRHQFGGPIARFQAVRHRLADSLVAMEALEATLTAARDEPGEETAALAKAVAGRTARTVTRHCQQVLAGIGFTAEHEFHRLLKRTMVLEGLFGSADAVALAVGRRLLATRHVATLIEL